MQIANNRLRTARFGLSIGRLQFLALFGWLVFFLAIGAAGCTKSAGTVSVHGHVSYRGEPLAASSVTFFPAKGRPVTAPAPQGEYTAELAPGDYTAIVAVGIEYPKGFKEGDPLPKPKVLLPDAYTSRANSTLKATIKSGQDQPIDFDLK
jgi:hypothetical protein